MNDYLKLGHMLKINESETDGKLNEISYYIHHHAVIKETSTSTRLHAVFDASMPTSSGLSLNDCLMVGPVVQSDLATIIMRFRVHTIVFTLCTK